MKIKLSRSKVDHAALYEIAMDNVQDAWSAFALLRETLETLCPVGAMRSGEHVACHVAPTFHAEAMELIAGIQALAGNASAPVSTSSSPSSAKA